jgi:hypothetical protein
MKEDKGESRAAAATYKKKQLIAAKEAREMAKVVRERERQAKAERLAHGRREKQQQKDAATAAKALRLSQKSNRVTSKKFTPKRQSGQRVMGTASGTVAAPAAPPPPPRTTSHGRNVDLPSKFR